MENYFLEKDIHLFCVKATSFPEGIKAAHENLVSVLNPGIKRNYFGVSYLYDNEILYLAASEVAEGAAIPAGFESYTLKKGNYISIFIPDFAKDISQIEKAFKKLLAYPGIDEQGCCAECYLPEGCNGNDAKDVRCMVRLAR